MLTTVPKVAGSGLAKDGEFLTVQTQLTPVNLSDSATFYNAVNKPAPFSTNQLLLYIVPLCMLNSSPQIAWPIPICHVDYADSQSERTHVPQQSSSNKSPW